MSQNQLITALTIILLIVMGGSMFVLFGGSQGTSLNAPNKEPIKIDDVNRFNLEIVEQQAYQLLNKQLIREGALPVKPPVTIGKANPFI